MVNVPENFDFKSQKRETLECFASCSSFIYRENEESMPALEESVKSVKDDAENKIEDKENEVAKQPQNHKEPLPKSEPQKRRKESMLDANGSFEGIHRIDPSELDLGKTVGRGGFGEVKRATWRGTVVAVKIIATAGSRESDVEKEVSIHKWVYISRWSFLLCSLYNS